jgi:hypothetical protein
MWIRYFRLWSVALFVWIAVLGMKAGSFRLVVFPFLALGALLVAQETLRNRHEQIGRTLSTALATLVLLYNLYATFPAARSWLESQFPHSSAATGRWQKDLDLKAAGKVDPPALEAREALQQYLLQKEDIVGQNIKAQLDALNAKRLQGTFGPEDENKERDVLTQFQKLVRDRSELQQLIAGSWAEQLTRSGQPPETQQAQSGTPPHPGTPARNSAAVVGKQSAQANPQTEETGLQPLVRRSYRLTPILPVQSEPSEYDISVQQCIRQSENVHCWGYVKNLTDGRIKLRMNHSASTFIDDEGNAGKFVGRVATEYPISGTPVRYEFDFHDSHINVKFLNFEIKVELEGDPSPRVRYDIFTFKGVPLQTEATEEQAPSDRSSFQGTDQGRYGV